MIKRLQNKIAESRLALPFMVVYACLIWLAAGLVSNGWWLQFGCFATSCYLMATMNNVHVLLRIYSRMVSCVFIALSCAACFLFPSLNGAVTEICMIACLLLWFTSYQDREASGRTYYAMLFLGIASMTFVEVLWLLPMMWVMMYTNLMSLSWKTWMASLLGVLTPYWAWFCWLLYYGSLSTLTDHFSQLATTPTFNIAQWTEDIPSLLMLLLVFVMAAIGTTHFIRKHADDKIRIRMLYAIFIWMDAVTLLMLLLMPQHYDTLIRLMVVFTSPLMGHYIALTRTRVTDITFKVLAVIILAITFYHLWLWNTSSPS